jgi:outer membrane protein assembly factor BamB
MAALQLELEKMGSTRTSWLQNSKRSMVRKAVCLALGLLTSTATQLHAEDGDWSQWRGPARDGIASSQKLLKSWPEQGPKLAWSYKEAGLGYSSSAISNGKLYTMGQRGEDCVAICIDAKSGKELWSQRFDRGTKPDDYLTGWGGGPRSTPTVDGNHVYFLSDLGELTCLKTEDGQKVWSRNLVKDFGGGIPQWGYSESVLIDGDRLLCTPGGEKFIVGLDKKTGEEKYVSKGFSDVAQYVSIMKTTVGNVPIYITATKSGLVAFNAENGEHQFTNPTTGNKTAVIPTPIIAGNEVYHSSAYKAGNSLIELSSAAGKVSMKERYHFDKESMENHHGGYILHEGTIYGFTNALRGTWMAQDLKSGEVLWSHKAGNSRSGSIAMADGLLYCYDDSEGVCYLAQPSREGWKELGVVKLPAQTGTDRGRGAIWAHPVIADQKLFIRDQELIYAFDIAR